jgi:nicotinamide-nucleotide amidase
MDAEVISIGDELTSGQRLDTNSQWLSTRLGEIGVRTLYHTTVADDLEANVRVVRSAIERADIVVATGGLGPTADDLTRDAIAAAANVELQIDEPTLAHIQNMFARRGRAMTDNNRVQAMFPAGSRIIPNPAGTAPGIDLAVPRPGGGKARIFALPGVPAEMREMWKATVEPAIRAMVGAARVIRHRRIKCFGVGESELEAKLPDLIRRGRLPSVGITVHGATITLRITAAGESPDACTALMAPTIDTIRQCLGELVFGEEDEELEHAVVRLLRAKNKTLATAECGSGGMIAHWLSEAPDSRTCYLGGMVLSNIKAVHNLVQPAGRAAISESRPDEAGFRKLLVEQMAGACREIFGADYALAVGELPRADANAAEPAKLWFAVASDLGTTAVSAPYIGHPDILKARGGKQALNLLRLTLLR